MPEVNSQVAVAGGLAVLWVTWWFQSIRRRLFPQHDPKEHPVTPTDLHNPKNKQTAQLSPPLFASHIVREGQEGQRSVIATLEEFLGRARTCSEFTNCVVASAQPVIEQRARKLAAQLDALPLIDRQALPLFGLPFSVKECYLLEGTDSTVGLKMLQGKPQSEDAALVRQMIALGAIPFCKTNVPQIMYAWECANPIHGVTSHPLHRSFIPGGSSGGEAALIAAGGSIVGLGTDIGGSCRIPAHMSGCCGLKCTKGRISLKGKSPPLIYGDGQQIIASCSGPLARTAEDLAFFLEAICSPKAIQNLRTIDSSILPLPWDRAAAEPEGNCRQPLTIGFYMHDGFLEASPACVRAVHVAKEALERSGARCIAFKPPDVDQAFKTYANLLSSGASHIIGLLDKSDEYISDSLKKLLAATVLPNWVRSTVADVLLSAGAPVMAMLIGALGKKSAGEYYEHVAAMQHYRTKFADAFTESFDLLLAPVHVLPSHAHMTSKDITAAFMYSGLFNLLDYPAGVVPVTTLRSDDRWDSPMRDKMLEPKIRRAYVQSLTAETPFPVGVQLVGRPFTEELVVRGMRQLETALQSEPPSGRSARL